MNFSFGSLENFMVILHGSWRTKIYNQPLWIIATTHNIYSEHLTQPSI